MYPSNADEVHLKMEFDRLRGHKRCVSIQYLGNIVPTFVLQNSKVCFHQQGVQKSLSRSGSIFQGQLVLAIFSNNGHTTMMRSCNLHETEDDITFLNVFWVFLSTQSQFLKEFFCAK